MDCSFCRGTMVPTEWQTVPEEDMRLAAGWHISRDVLKLGWFWCSECNEFGHSPTQATVNTVALDTAK